MNRIQLVTGHTENIPNALLDKAAHQNFTSSQTGHAEIILQNIYLQFIYVLWLTACTNGDGCLARFPSEEWAKLFMEQVNANKNYEDAAKTWEGDFLFVIQADAELKEPAAMYVDLWHGKCRGSALMKAGEEKKTAYVFSGPYGNWKKLISTKADPIQGLLTGKFKLQGDMAKVLRAVRAAKELVETTGKVPTEWA